MEKDLTIGRLAEAAAVDELAFGRRWSNDTASLDAIREAAAGAGELATTQTGCIPLVARSTP